MSIPPGTDTEKSSIGGVRLLNGIAHCLLNGVCAIKPLANGQTRNNESRTKDELYKVCKLCV